MRIIALFVICLAMVTVIPMERVLASYGSENQSTIDRDGYVVELRVYDWNTRGPVTRNTKKIRRIYSIVNYSREPLNLKCFGVDGFAMIHIDSNTAVDTGGTGNQYYNITVPPHSTTIVGTNDETGIGDKRLKQGYYRCISGCTLWFEEPPTHEFTNILTEILIKVN